MKTNLDLHRHAQETAFALLDVTHPLDRLEAAAAAFKASGAHKADWEYWFNEFDRIRNHYTGCKAQPSKTEQIRVKEEAAAKEKVS